jgi:hypothetical protein
MGNLCAGAPAHLGVNALEQEAELALQRAALEAALSPNGGGASAAAPADVAKMAAPSTTEPVVPREVVAAAAASPAVADRGSKTLRLADVNKSRRADTGGGEEQAHPKAVKLVRSGLSTDLLASWDKQPMTQSVDDEEERYRQDATSQAGMNLGPVPSFSPRSLVRGGEGHGA